MKIIQISTASYTIGGMSEYVRNVSSRLARNHDVTVYATNPSHRLPQNEIIDGVKVIRFSGFNPNGAYYLSLSMLGELMKNKFDIVHAHNYHGFPFHIARFSGKNVFCLSPCYHGSGHTSFRKKLLQISQFVGQSTLNEANYIFAASEFEKNLLLRDFDLSKKEVLVIPRGISFPEFDIDLEEKHNGSKKNILFVGRLVDYKGIQYLVEAMPQIDSNISLNIVGSGPLKQFLMNRIKKLNISDRVKFYQNLDRKDLVKMYHDADLFVLLSKFEAFSKVISESLYSGVPCLVANNSALTEWIDNKVCFTLNNPTDINELALKINDIIYRKFDPLEVRNTFLGSKIIDWDEVVDTLEFYYNKKMGAL